MRSQCNFHSALHDPDSKENQASSMITGISDENFNLKVKDAGKKLVGKEKHVTDQFEKYVKKYIHAVTVKDQNILSNKEYVDTTLINFHADLGL